MAGGQKGLSIIGEAGVAFAFLGFIGGCTVRGWIDGSQPDDPSDKAAHECEVAYEEARDGDGDDPAAIVNESWCQQHNAHQERLRAMEQQEETQDQMEQVAP